MQLIDPPGGRPWALLTLCGASLLLNIVLLIRLDTAHSPPPPTLITTEHASAAAVPEPVIQPPIHVPTTIPDVSPPPLRTPPPLPPNTFAHHAAVQHSLSRTFQHTLAEDHADIVSAVYARLFMWDLDLARELQANDGIHIVYEWNGPLTQIPIAQLTSNRLGRTLTAYRFHSTGDIWASHWNGTGEEISLRLKESPLRDYQQVTSRLRDRPNHKGMDFKVPTGAEVVSPKAGTVIRTDWNTRFNGNCVEVSYTDGTLARFLHLSSTDVTAGQSVSANQPIGMSGNTGHSTNPHLHYELEKNGHIVDPLTYHGTIRRTLPQSDFARFEAERIRLDGLLSTSIP